MKRRVAFLDRDGTINADRGYVTAYDQWELLPRVVDAIKSLRRMGLLIAVVTNQSAVAKGKCTASDVMDLHKRISAELAIAGAPIDAIAFCPHSVEDGCECRKPKTGLAQVIERELAAEIDYPSSWTVGDKPSDVTFGNCLGTRTVLLKSGYWQPTNIGFRPDLVADSLWEAAQFIFRCSIPTT